MRGRHIKPRLKILVLVTGVLGLVVYGTRVTAVAASPSSGPSGATVDIPEGTPVIVHFFGSALGAFNSCHLGSGFERDKEIVLQVDEDVSVNGTVVVPRGSVGLAQCDQVKNGKYNQDYGDVRAPGLFGPRTVHQTGPSRTGVIQYVFHSLYVFSTASTQLELDPAPDYIDVAHHNASFGAYGLNFDVNSQFTVKLKHAVVTFPGAI